MVWLQTCFDYARFLPRELDPRNGRRWFPDRGAVQLRSGRTRSGALELGSGSQRVSNNALQPTGAAMSSTCSIVLIEPVVLAVTESEIPRAQIPLRILSMFDVV